jgi:hypothetical protein
MYGFLLEGLSFRCAGFCIYIDSTFLYIDRAPLVGSRCSNTMVSGKLEDGLDISLMYKSARNTGTPLLLFLHLLLAPAMGKTWAGGNRRRRCHACM